MKIKCFFVVFTICLILCGCKSQPAGLIFDNEYDNQRWEQLSARYKSLPDTDSKIMWAEDVYSFYDEMKRPYQMRQILRQTAADIADTTDDDTTFRSYLYFLTANSLKSDSNAVNEATYFFQEVDPNDYNLTFDGQPIGYIICLYAIKTGDIAAKKAAYNILLEKFKRLIDVPYTQYELALLYKNELEMDTAVSIMQKIISESPKYRNIPTNINYAALKDEISYYNMKKNWIYKDLDVLIKNIKYSIIRKDITSLKKYIPKTDFECIVAQKTLLVTNWTFQDLQITRRWHTNIVFSNELEPQSNENEAWLKTYNWGFPQLHTWYFHFRRINYPYDEKIDRGWEWQGIIFGDMF